MPNATAVSDPPAPAVPLAKGAVYARVAVDVPLPELFDYAVEPPEGAGVGDWVVVPWGRARRIGLVVELTTQSGVPPERLRTLSERLAAMPTMDRTWLDLIAFAARYYHCGIGELALPAVPKLLRVAPGPRSRGAAAERARGRFDKLMPPAQPSAAPQLPVLTVEQQAAVDALRAIDGHGVAVLHGVTGSGKTEVYFRWLEAVLERGGQVLMLVPEIALTPQLAARVAARFPRHPLAVLHSDMPDAQRAAYWLACAEGRARIVVGTRLAVMAPLPRLQAIVVDEEHDASFKQQEGPRYSARDLAIALAALRGIPIVLGSATPSLETWHAVRRGRYRLLTLRERASGAALPAVRMLPLRTLPARHGLTEPAIAAIEETLARGEQALVFLNRRGFAPVLSCEACGWLSDCEQCDAFRVLHRTGGGRFRLICHHCAADATPPRACPECGNVDVTPVGQGTQRLEDALGELFPQARIGRLDRDVARRRGATTRLLDAAHAGEVDLLVGTQMLAKGHDFERLTRVVVVDADSGLFAADFRAPERLFATLMQVAGRAGRHRANGEVLIQTRFPDHLVFEALVRHDYERFADAQLEERRQAQLPPFVHQALLTAHARDETQVRTGLALAREALLALPEARALTVCDPVPMPLAQLRGETRMQVLVESPSRKSLHAALGPWVDALHALRLAVRWQLVVDPLEI